MTHAAAQPRLFPVTAMIIAALFVIATQGIAESERRGLFKPLPQKRAEPVRITSTTLEWDEKAKVATFSGSVHVVQGETDVRSNTLVVFYEDQKNQSGSKKTTDASQIRRMEAHGSVFITQQGRCATGDRAEFDMRTNTVTMTGNVVIAKGDDVVRGERVVVDLTTGLSRVEAGGRRVEGMFNSKSRGRGC